MYYRTRCREKARCTTGHAAGRKLGVRQDTVREKARCTTGHAAGES